MRRSTKIWFIAATFFVIFGSAMFAAIMMKNQWNFLQLDTTELNKSQNPGEFKHSGILLSFRFFTFYNFFYIFPINPLLGKTAFTTYITIYIHRRKQSVTGHYIIACAICPCVSINSNNVSRITFWTDLCHFHYLIS